MQDSVTFWFNAAGRYPVLSEADHIRIARKIQASEPGSAEHTKWVNKLCLHNLRLVVKFTKSYLKNTKHDSWTNTQTTDYLQQGYFGLRRAAEKFDPERGYAFSTYSNAWIRQALGRYHVEGISLIRVPESSARELFYYENHGVPRNEKTARWVPKVIDNARRAFSLTSYDCQVTEDTSSLLEVLSDENRISPNTSQASLFESVDTAGIMNELGIDIKTQSLIMQYVKRGNLDTVLTKNKCSTKATRERVRKAIDGIKEYCHATAGR